MARLVLSLLAAALLPAIGSLCGQTSDDKISYTGFTVFRATPETQEQVNVLRRFAEDKLDNDQLEFWTHPSGVNQSVDILAGPESQRDLVRLLETGHIHTKKWIRDLGKLISREQSVRGNNRDATESSSNDSSSSEATSNDAHENELDSGKNSSTRLSSGFSPKYFYRNYHTFSALEAKIKSMEADPRVRVEVAGHSVETRPIYLVKVSKNHKTSQKPIILIDALHHAREWISYTSLMYVLESILTDDMPTILARGVGAPRAPTSRDLKSLLEEYDFWFLPMVNPDGFEHTRLTDRMWRKNRSSKGLSCLGVDLNRNYDFHWAESGTSRFCRSDIYPGPKALSEPEAKTVANIMNSNAQRIKAYFSFHCYSQKILIPYGYSLNAHARNFNDLLRVCQVGQAAVRAVRNTWYDCQTAASLYPAAGGSDDYAHGHSKIPFSYTFELPDTGRFGFILPPSEIVPVGQEAMTMLTAMVRAIQAN